MFTGGQGTIFMVNSIVLMNGNKTIIYSTEMDSDANPPREGGVSHSDKVFLNKKLDAPFNIKHQMSTGMDSKMVYTEP